MTGGGSPRGEMGVMEGLLVGLLFVSVVVSTVLGLRLLSWVLGDVVSGAERLFVTVVVAVSAVGLLVGFERAGRRRAAGRESRRRNER